MSTVIDNSFTVSFSLSQLFIATRCFLNRSANRLSRSVVFIMSSAQADDRIKFKATRIIGNASRVLPENLVACHSQPSIQGLLIVCGKPWIVRLVDWSISIRKSVKFIYIYRVYLYANFKRTKNNRLLKIIDSCDT